MPTATGLRAPRPTGVALYLPIVRWISTYRRPWLRADLIAGFTVAVMLVPQAMAYAGLAGMPPVTGLYAAIAGIIAYALLGTSGSLAVGPVAITSLLTVSGLAAITTPDDPAYVTTAALLALMVGVLLIGFGLARLGVLVNLLSHPVISGFTSAAAIVIALSQLEGLLGLDLGRPDGTVAVLGAVASRIGETNTATAVVGFVAIGVLLAGRHLSRRFPWPLLVVALGIVLVSSAGLDGHGVAILRDVPSGLPTLSMPAMDGGLVGRLLPVALTIAVVAYAEGISVAKAIARRSRDPIDANQELLALGASNTASGAFGGFPVAGGFSRTAVNFQAGARTPLAGLVTAVVLVITVVWLTAPFAYVPTTVLSAIVVVAVLGLVDVRDAVETWRIRRSDGITLAVTFLSTLLIGIEIGLAIGVGCSLAVLVIRNVKPHTTHLGRVEGTTLLRNTSRFTTRECPEVLVLRMDSPLLFANTRVLVDEISSEVAARPALRFVVLDASTIVDLDASGAHALGQLVEDLRAAGVELHLATVRGPVRDVLARAGYWIELEDRVHPTIEAAASAVDSSGALWRIAPDEVTPGHVP